MLTDIGIFERTYDVRLEKVTGDYVPSTKAI